MGDVNWWLMALSFLFGLVLTFALTIRRVKREVPVYGALGRGSGVGDVDTSATGRRPDAGDADAAATAKLPTGHGEPFVWVLATSGWITLMVVHFVSPDSPLSMLRACVVFAFVLLCPGLAVTRLLPLREPVEVWVVATALSLSLGLLVSVAFTIARNDSMTQKLLTLAVITTVATVVDGYRSARRAVATADQGAQS